MLKRNISKTCLNGLLPEFLAIWLLPLVIVALPGLISYSSLADAQWYEPASTWPDSKEMEADEQAKAAMQSGNYAIAYCLWQPLAESGDKDAQYNIGWMYHNGYGLRIDDEIAFFWWLKAAANGSIDALYALGNLYSEGLGVERNAAIALGWYLSAAGKGHPEARDMLHEILQEPTPLTRLITEILLKKDFGLLGKTYQVSVDKANTRQGPAKSYPVVTVLQRSHRVVPLRRQGNWTYIGITESGQTAWIFSRLLKLEPGIYADD